MRKITPDMENKKTSKMQDMEPTEADPVSAPAILIQRLETVASVHYGPGGDTLIEAAWKAAGNYLMTKVNEGQSAAVQFTYGGVTHHASVEVPE